MPIPIFRPEVVRISTEPSPPCLECSWCKTKNGTVGICKHPDNYQGLDPEAKDGRTMYVEFLPDITHTEGHCGGFTYRQTRVVA